MKILFIQPESDFSVRGTTYPVCRSMMVTATYLKDLGHDIRVFDRCIDKRRYRNVINEFSAQLTVIYVPPTASVSDARQISDYCRSKGSVVVWGEVVAASVAQYIVENNIADFVITGETEEKIRLLVEEKSYEHIPGLTYVKDGKVITNENRNNTDLSVLPEIDWELIDVKKCFRAFPGCRKMLYMYTSRGCPYKCSYCYNTMFYNSEYRKRDISHVLNEIKYLEEKYGLDGVNFSDELLILTKEEIQQIHDFRLKNNLSFIWGGEVRADIYNEPDILGKMYDAGCRWLLIGIETGSHVTREHINKPMNHEMIRDFIDRCKDARIQTFGSFIIGFPGETSERLKETTQFALSLNPDAFLFNYFVAIPGTPFGDRLIAEGRLNAADMFSEKIASRRLQTLAYNYSEIPSKELVVVKSCFDRLTFTRKKTGDVSGNPFVLKAFDMLKHFADGNIRKCIKNIYNAIKMFFTVFYYSFAFPDINRKYGIYNINKQR